MSRLAHTETHKLHKASWLRAAVLGANDGLISTSGLVVGMASAGTELRTLLLTAAAGLTAGAFSMAAGEYVSVSSQADVEKADRALEERELAEKPEWEQQELEAIYRQRGLSPELAAQVAHELTAHNALDAHLRDELGITAHSEARPLQAALASATAFVVGALPPIALVMLGAVAARLGGAPMVPGALRVLLWGALAMGASAAIGKLFGAGPVG
jgi:VIT1/CCC1 family predicted Fe2+/Mn2+ transporter